MRYQIHSDTINPRISTKKNHLAHQESLQPDQALVLALSPMASGAGSEEAAIKGKARTT